MTFFYLLTSFVILQRLLEVAYARSNEKAMRRLGAIEVGAGHYKWIVLLHVLFFLSLVVEVWSSEGGLGAGWQVFLVIFAISQVLRIWALSSLGRFWNTKILVLPGAEKVKKGPYRWLPHPNYLVVALEIAALPLVFGAWRTALIFSIANALLLLLVRIPAEEKALQQLKS
ncbi:isoprenylcysteine carboxyl methyltransferase family protein [Planococcus sp. SE5232]|uniref:isoprenylcysteine carboxyl methyltransferase family protein n=1 Tax=unclassified Planococcus (in: firmicutes) TaxID=2662419 RepID=UPI001CBB624A|nr:isoprenylcysteine carboxylmethyltransferase family protein [Planococcus sp. 4-30]